MTKLKNITLDELKKAEDAAFDVAQVVSDLHRRASQGYADEIPEPLQLASSFASVSRAFAEMSAWLLAKAAIQEQKRVLEARLREIDPSAPVTSAHKDNQP